MEVVPTTLTMVLMGRTGNGKSATGNNILGRKAFVSQRSSSSITKSSELQTSVRQDRQVINVIDTPGLFDASSGTDYIASEIVKCIDLTSNGIHAVLLVFSVQNRFSQEEAATVKTLQNLFGSKILDYAIVVFTGGDLFDDDDDDDDGDGNTLEDYLRGCPMALKDILTACKNRFVVFDNKTKSGTKKAEQVNNLLTVVNELIAENGGQAFTHRLFLEGKFEEKLTEVKSKLEQQMEEEREARRKVEEESLKLQQQMRDEIQSLKGQLGEALQRPPVVVHVQPPPPPPPPSRSCVIQ